MYCPLEQALGVAVSTLQFVTPAPGVEALLLKILTVPEVFEKFVTSSIYHEPASGLSILTISVAAKEYEQSTIFAADKFPQMEA